MRASGKPNVRHWTRPETVWRVLRIHTSPPQTPGVFSTQLLASRAGDARPVSFGGMVRSLSSEGSLIALYHLFGLGPIELPISAVLDTKLFHNGKLPRQPRAHP